MKYKLVRASSNENFNEEVTKHLNEKWELYGNPILGEYSVNYREYCQAMVLQDEQLESNCK